MCQWLSGSPSSGRPFTLARQTNIVMPSISGSESAHGERAGMAAMSLETERPEVTAMRSSEMTKRKSYNILIYHNFVASARPSHERRGWTARATLRPISTLPDANFVKREKQMAKKTIMGAIADSVTEAVTTTIDALAHPISTVGQAEAAASSVMTSARRTVTKAARKAAGKGKRAVAKVKRKVAKKKVSKAVKKAVRKIAGKKAASRRKHR